MTTLREQLKNEDLTVAGAMQLTQAMNAEGSIQRKLPKLSLKRLTDRQKEELKGLMYWCWEKAMDKVYACDIAYQAKCDKNIEYNEKMCQRAGVEQVYIDMVKCNTDHTTDYSNLYDVIPA